MALRLHGPAHHAEAHDGLAVLTLPCHLQAFHAFGGVERVPHAREFIRFGVDLGCWIQSQNFLLGIVTQQGDHRPIHFQIQTASRAVDSIDGALEQVAITCFGDSLPLQGVFYNRQFLLAPFQPLRVNPDDPPEREHHRYYAKGGKPIGLIKVRLQAEGK